MIGAVTLALALASWPEVDYEMRLSLDESAHSVTGSSRISFSNTTDQELADLWFHLYMNAFQTSETIFMLGETGSGSRSGRALRRPGSLLVRTLTWNEQGPENLWPLADPHSPDNPKDRTDIRLPLPRPVRRGERITLAIEFEARLPELVERSGYEGDFYFLSGFYPKLARLSPSGDFDHFAYHPLAEFSSNFGCYRVFLDLPSSHRVGTTGRVLSERVDGARLHLETYADRVHDFVFTSSPTFVEETRTFGSTEVKLLVPSAHPDLMSRYFEVVEPLLREYGERFGDYPYPNFTVVHPPFQAAPAGGMEYPRLITTGGPGALPSPGVHYLELVTAHEVAHQWFQGMLASNEYHAPWLDESLTTLAELRFLEKQFGRGSLISLGPLIVSEVSAWRLRGLDTRVPNAMLSAPEYGGFDTLARTIYARAPLALETVRRVYGSARFDEALRVYADRFRFGYPTSEDFFEVVRGVIDQRASDSLRAALSGELGGYRVRIGKASKTGDAWKTEVQVSLEGTISFPTRIEARFEDGKTKSFPVDGETPLTITHQAPLSSLTVDPDDLIVVDPDRTNNHLRPGDPPRTFASPLLSTLAALLLSVLFT